MPQHKEIRNQIKQIGVQGNNYQDKAKWQSWMNKQGAKDVKDDGIFQLISASDITLKASSFSLKIYASIQVIF